MGIETEVHRDRPAAASPHVGDLDGAGLSRQTVERHLLNSGLDEIVSACSGLSSREKLVLRLASPRLLLIFVGWLVVVAVWMSVEVAAMTAASRFTVFAICDLATAAGIVVTVAVSLGALRRDGGAAARKVALAGAGSVLVAAAVPYAIFSVADPSGAVGSLSDTVGTHRADAQPLPLHVLIVALAAAIGGLEARFNLASRLASMFRSGRRSILRTVGDVLWTLPIIVAALFILAFADELWKVVGQLSFGRFLALNMLLLICIVGFIWSLAREQAEATLESHSGDSDEPGVARIPSPPTDPRDDPDLNLLATAGIEPLGVKRTVAVERLVTRQWSVQIATRVILAGLVIFVIVLIVTALTVTKPVLDEWIAPAEATALWSGPDGLYVTVKHLEISVLLGAFAMVAFSGLALADDTLCERLLAPERNRILVLLTLAGTYESAVEGQFWLGRPDDDWKSYAAFLADDPNRRNETPRAFGKRWRSEGGGSRWRAGWNPATGELYAFRSRPPGPLKILAVCDAEDKVTEALDGWRLHEREENSLKWLRDRANRLRPDKCSPERVLTTTSP
jgi:uncharacterized PurR-regulated membrane protein YhhQ (DUF165 family)